MNRKRPKWDFRENSLLFWEDIEKARELERKDPDAFKASARDQKVVTFVRDWGESQAAVERGFEKSIPRALRDLTIARDGNRKTKERFAAIDRFGKSFGRIPLNVGIALFHWLDGGNKNEVIQELGRTVVAFTIDPKTGELAEADKRGRKRISATVNRIELAARLINHGFSQRTMAPKLFPNMPPRESLH